MCFFFKAQKDRILIKGGIVVNDDDMIEADVFIESGVIKWVVNCLMSTFLFYRNLKKYEFANCFQEWSDMFNSIYSIKCYYDSFS